MDINVNDLDCVEPKINDPQLTACDPSEKKMKRKVHELESQVKRVDDTLKKKVDQSDAVVATLTAEVDRNKKDAFKLGLSHQQMLQKKVTTTSLSIH